MHIFEETISCGDAMVCNSVSLFLRIDFKTIQYQVRSIQISISLSDYSGRRRIEGDTSTKIYRPFPNAVCRGQDVVDAY